MGGSASVSVASRVNEISVSESFKWKERITKDQALELYVDDGTVPSNCNDMLLRLRLYLADQILLAKFGEYAREQKELAILMCWTELLEYKNISETSIDYQLSVAGHLIDKYFAKSPVVVVPGVSVDDTFKTEVAVALRDARKSGTSLPHQLFDSFHQSLLVGILDRLFRSYIQTPKYIESVRDIKKSYNRVSTDDFEYLNILGEGSFGFVVHVRKISTGTHFAMKIQQKRGLLDSFAECPTRVTYEKDALVSCHHPFIVNLDYAFQDANLAFLVMDLGTAGTLKDMTTSECLLIALRSTLLRSF